MKKSIKKLFIFILSVVCLCSFALFVSCGAVSFENFKDQTITISLGQTYVLETGALQASDGKYYSVSVEVKDSKGNAVKTVGGRLVAEDLGGYTVKYTVGSSSRTVTIAVVNDVLPNIVIGDSIKTLMVGGTYTIPTIDVYDLSGEEVTPEIKVLYGIDEQEIAIANGSVLCENAGKYTLSVTATNSAGKTCNKTYDFFARSTVEDNEYENFSDEGSIYEISTTGRVISYDWLEDALGRNGVMQFDMEATNQYVELFNILPRQSLVNYLEKEGEEGQETYKYKYLVYTMYVETSENSIKSFVPVDDKLFVSPKVQYNMWFDYVFETDKIFEFFSKDKTTGAFKATLRDATTIYIDKIEFADQITELPETISGGVEFALGQEIDFNELISVNGQTLQYTVLLEGKPISNTNGKFTPKYVSDNYQVKVSVVNGVGEDKSYSFKVTTDKGSVQLNKFTEYIERDTENVVMPSLIIKNASGQEVTSEYTISQTINYTTNAGITQNNATFTKARSGEYEFVLTATNSDGSISFIKTANLTVGPYGEDEVIYVSRSDAKTLIGSQIGSATIAENTYKDNNVVNPNEYQGAQVIKFRKENLKTLDGAVKFNFAPVHTADYYKKFATVIIPLYLSVNEPLVTEFNVDVLGEKFTSKPNTWNYIELPVDVMISAMEEDKLYPLVTFVDWAITISVSDQITDGLNGKTLTACFGDITVVKQEFNPMLFKASQETFKNVSLNGDSESNILLDSQTISSLNITGDYTGDSAVSLSVNHGSKYYLGGVSALFKQNIANYEYATIWLAVYKNPEYITPEGTQMSFNSNFASILSKNYLEQIIRFDEHSETENAFNTWYKFTLPAKHVATLLDGGKVGILQVYINLTGNERTEYIENTRIIIGDIELENQLHNSNGDNYRDENYFS